MAVKARALDGIAARKLAALLRELRAEPKRTDKAGHDAWRDAVVSRATALFRVVGRKAVMANLSDRESTRLDVLLGEAAAASKQLATAN